MAENVNEQKFDIAKELTYDIITMLLDRDVDFDLTYSIGTIWIYILNTRYSIRVISSGKIYISDMWTDGPDKKGKEFDNIAELTEWLDKKKWGRKH